MCHNSQSNEDSYKNSAGNKIIPKHSRKTIIAVVYCTIVYHKTSVWIKQCLRITDFSFFL